MNTVVDPLQSSMDDIEGFEPTETTGFIGIVRWGSIIVFWNSITNQYQQTAIRIKNWALGRKL